MGYVGGGWEHASIRMLPTGKVEVITGTSPHGQGHETAWSQIVADRLGVPFDDVEVLHGDTQIAARGLDTYGSRSLTVGAMAVLAAADKVIEKAKPIAAQLLEASADDVEFTGGRFGVRGTDAGMALGDLAFAVFQGHKMVDEAERSLDAEATLDPDDFSFPHGTHLCAAEVDTETGMVRLRSYVCVDDIGKVINPLIVEGQVHGGIAQGIAQALYEEAVYDESGTLVSGSFAEYLLPSAADLPALVTDRTETPATEERAGRQGCRRGRHDRLHPGGGERDRRRGPAPRRERRRRCRARRTGSGRRSARPSPSRKVVGHDPGRIRVRRARHRRRGAGGAGRVR